ncbi:type IX secretion system motor protein PorM/GldM [Zunongwangia sp. HGR-M22]|uniref:type IX secretion system motor protein PorM/GldM n=1 Tax=Zunongwangia sp. HGR-M22 TaxID=3015168 RepID=UPI0022DD4B80|nr:gliding motility protein GldM [Zunongwangia sp. HGR-M22]WBL25199.1 gliding motility protein GldM [Zunongwangia sp. HGR-M22]
MASGKQSPRQKMINLMYLVFIAMMALNMSKEVLVAFGSMNEKLEQANATTEQRNASAMQGLQSKANEQAEKYAELAQKAETINQLSQNLDSYIEGVKNELTADLDDPQDYQAMDKTDILDERFFTGGKVSPRGQEFVDKIKEYREGVINTLGEDYSALNKEIAAKFDTSEEEDGEGTKKPWLTYNFEGFPLIASITQMTQIQSDVKTTENDILSSMLSGQLQEEVSMTNYSTLLETPKSAYYQGETFNGAIVLGRTDATTKPNKVELKLDGRTLSGDDYSLQGGKVVLNVPAGNAGSHKLTGQLIFAEDGEETLVPVEQEFAVIPKPNSATISADKMNVVYRGVKNPLTISMAGVQDNNISASAPGLSRVSGSSYVMDVTSVQAREVKINVTGTIDGKSYPSSSTFRIKDIPSPVGSIRKETGSVKMQRNSLEISEVGAELPDFDFDIGLRVTGFSFKVSGQPTVTVRGNRLDNAAKAALRRAGRGETVQIFDIEASLNSNSGYRLKKIAPVFVELTN